MESRDRIKHCRKLVRRQWLFSKVVMFKVLLERGKMKYRIQDFKFVKS